MGTYRFILASLVLYSHAFGKIFGVNPGVMAVISFFVISGYVMSLLIERNYPSFGDVPTFYLDRAARLFPQYLFYVFVTLLLASTIGIHDDFVADRGPIYILANIIILPLGFYMFALNHAVYVPPAWSLGLEVTFYLLFPFFWLLPKRAKYVALAASILVFVLAYFGVINSNWFGYRFIPGTFFIFAAGASLAVPAAIPTRYALMAGTGMAGAFIALLFFPTIRALPYNFEVTLGAAIGIAAIAWLKRYPRTSWDEYLGNLSYGVFLSHYLFIFIADRFGIDRWLIVPIGALVAAVLTYEFVEKPVLKVRRNLRKKRQVDEERHALA
ncbi:acyltransferase [Agrobacterium rhizogenes]|nr:acyltransferase [Rhizobium rhizogenes]